MRRFQMAVPKGPRTPTEMHVAASKLQTRSRWRTLPPDLLRQACKRVAIMSLVFASLWAISLVMNIIVAPLVGHVHTPAMAWPFPGNLIASIGLGVSLTTFLLVSRLKDRPQALLLVSHVNMILGAALVAILMHWAPSIEAMRISWLCLMIVAYPSIVPTPPLKTLTISLIVATLDPIALWIAHLRGATFQTDTLQMIWYFLPNYIAVGLAMIPAHIISGLGRQVNQARELGSYQLGDLLG